MFELKRLNEDNYDELINLLNSVFARKNNQKTDFEKDLPKMFVKDEQHMARHLGVFDDGKLVSCVGIYPMPTVIGDNELLFATVGNVATHWDYTGKGYMNMLMTEAMKEIEKMGVDVSRLGGLRQRYNRFGYDSCGSTYSFSLTKNNNEKSFNYEDDYTFVKIDKEDIDSIAFCECLYNNSGIRIKRDAYDGYQGFYAAMTTWQNIPYLVKDTKGNNVGYICVKGNSVGEVYGLNPDVTVKIISLWQKKNIETVSFSVAPYDIELARIFTSVCENMRIGFTCHFKVMNFEKITNALLKLKSKYVKMVNGEFVLKIEDYGKIKLFVHGDNVGCVRVDEKESLTLSRFDAQRFLFGPFPPISAGNADGVVSAWLPLPLSWNLQDRG